MRQNLENKKWPPRKNLDACEERNSLLLGLYKFRLSFKRRLNLPLNLPGQTYNECLSTEICLLRKKLLEVFKLCTMKYTYIYIHKIILLCCEI